MHRAVLFAIQENGRMLRTAGILQMKKGIVPRFQEYVKWERLQIYWPISGTEGAKESGIL